MKSNYIVYSMLGIIFLYFLITVMQNTAEPSINLEGRNFTENATYYTIAHTPNNADLTLYYFDNTTYAVPTSLYNYNKTHIAVYTNGTLAYPNITTNQNYYYSYSYQQSATVMGIDFNGIAFIVFLGVVIVIVIAMTSEKRRK
jgi:hypothetical protein